MPNNPTPIQIAWVDFAKSVQTLLIVQADDRPLDQYLELRNAVLDLILRENFLTELDVAWNSPNDTPLAETRNVLIIELKAFPRAAEVAKATEKPEEAKSSWKKTLDRASTVAGSVKDLLDKLPPYAKAALTLFGELIDLFKGKD